MTDLAGSTRKDAASGWAVECRGLGKAYRARWVVEDLWLTVPRGSLFGVVGPNGAGKTTTLSMATGLLRPDAGEALVLGTDVWQHPLQVKARIGVAEDGMRLFDILSGAELLKYVGALRSMPADVVAQRTAELLGVLELTDAAHTPVADYSAGMTKKISLACALLHGPELVVLDEPFEAVDPVSGQVIRNILRQYVAGGGTVVMSSHVMELVEELCDHVAVIAQGTVLAAGPTSEVRAGRPLQERFLEMVGAGDLRPEGLSWLHRSQPSSD